MAGLCRAIVLALALAGCSYVEPTTALKVAMTDPLTADPADIAVAITLPSGVAPVPNSAVLTIDATGPTGTTRAKATLAQTSMAQNRYLYALKPQDVLRLRQVQQDILAQKALGKTSGSFGVFAEYCTTGDGPADDARGSIDVRLASGGPLMPLYTDAPLDKIVALDKLRAAKPCGRVQ